MQQDRRLHGYLESTIVEESSKKSHQVAARIFTSEHSMVSIVTIQPYSQHEIHNHPQEQVWTSASR